MFTTICVLVGVACTFDPKLTWRQASAISTVAWKPSTCTWVYHALWSNGIKASSRKVSITKGSFMVADWIVCLNFTDDPQ